MSPLHGILAGLTVLRLAELVYARRNTRRLLERGGQETAPGHYPALVVLHAAWLAAMAVTIPAHTPPQTWLLVAFTVLLGARLWVITSLGPYWTTRIITLPDAPLIRRGPFRFLRHPNYVVVAGEIAALPLAFGAWRLALLFSMLNGALLAWRIRCEDRALAPRRRLTGEAMPTPVQSRSAQPKPTSSQPGERLSPRVARTVRGPIEYAAFGAGPPVLALHGAMGGWDQGVILARTVDLAAYSVVAPSRPGYLGTPLSVGRSPEQQADACADLLNALGIGKAAVVAVSGGGPCAIQFALRHAHHCRALVLISTCSGPIDAPVPLSFHVMRILARLPFVAAAIGRRARRNVDRAASSSIPDPVLRRRTLDHPVAGPLFSALLASPSASMAKRLPGTENDIKVTRSTGFPLEDLAVPVLVVHGTEDRLLPFDRHGKGFAERIPAAELLAVEGGDHVSIFTHRDLVSARINQFLGRVETA